MPKLNLASLRRGLEKLEQRYRSSEALAMDPLSIALRYQNPMDQEIAAWVAAHLAYGRVAPMLRAIEKVLLPLGRFPSEHLRASGDGELRRELQTALTGWVWRFHTSGDLIEWILIWKKLDEESGGRGLEAHLLPRAEEKPDDRLSSFVQRLRLELPATHGIRFMLPDPKTGSACKRWRLFLRWMVRSQWPDLGLWQTYPSEDLVIPLDTHVARISRYLEFSARKTADDLMAREITNFLKRLDPEDPLRFDFALAHLGIMGDCPETHQAAACAQCPMSRMCSRAEWIHKNIK